MMAETPASSKRSARSSARTVLCLVQPSTATMPSRASMPTAIWPGHCLQDLDDGGAVDRMALDGAVEVDQVQPFAAGIGEGLGLGGRTVVEHRGARHVAAQQAHALAVLEVDRGEQNHRGADLPRHLASVIPRPITARIVAALVGAATIG